MKIGKILFLIVCLLAATIVVLPERAVAVPSFSKQTGRPCSSCHTIWPRLNRTGREFKLTAYTDVAEDYPKLMKDRLDQLQYLPVSLAVLMLPYEKVTDQNSETKIPDEVALFLAGRISPYIGAFVEFAWENAEDKINLELAKGAGYYRFGNTTVGAVAMKSDPGGGDIFNTLRGNAYEPTTSPLIFTQTRAAGDFFQYGGSNQGGIVYGKFLNNILYASAGVFRGHESNDPADFYGRVAAEYPFGEANANIGAYVYTGKERYQKNTPMEYESDVTRSGVDGSYQWESGSHLVDVHGIYMYGKDKDLDGSSGNDIKFNGFYGEVLYAFDRKYMARVSYDYMSSDQDQSLDKKGWTVGVAYFPWLNTKFGLDFSYFTLPNDQTEKSIRALVHLYF